MEQGFRGPMDSREHIVVTSERESREGLTLQVLTPWHTSRKRGSQDALRSLGLLRGLSRSRVSLPPHPIKDYSAHLLDVMSHSELGSLSTATAAQLCSELFPDGQWGQVENSCD